jgi:hypothetical protein
MKNKFLLFFGLFFFSFSFGQTISPEAKFSILTIGKGQELHSLFGHTALRIADEKNGFDIVFNFGYFDFNTPNFYLKFVKGDLLYHAEIEQYYQLLAYYQYFDRSVAEQELNLTVNQKQQLFDKLNNIALTNERFYIYKFIDDNCTTRVQKAVADVANVSLEKVNGTDVSYRHIINNYLGDRYFEKFGINIIFGPRVDQKAKQLFLPDELFQSIDGKNIEKNNVEIYTSNSVHPAPWWNSFWVVSALIVIMVILNNSRLYAMFLAIIGCIGVFFCSIGLFSLHQEVLWNYNTLLFNPILLFIVFYYYKNAIKMLSYLKKIYLACILIYLIILLNKDHLFLMVPYVFIFPFIVYRFLKSKRITIDPS